MTEMTEIMKCNAPKELGDALLPCPFCGGQPELVELDKQVSNPGSHHPVKCLTIDCPMHYIYPDIKAWNKRATVSRLSF